MSKQIKQMQMGVLRQEFKDVRDMVLFNMVGVPATVENQMRLQLRKKNIRLQMVKNSLARRIFSELGVSAGEAWTGPTVLAWGADSLADLSKSLQGYITKNKNIVVKTAVAEGQPVAFADALKFPTRAEALGTIIGMIVGVASQIASQIDQISKKEPAAVEAPAAAPA